MQNIMRNSNRIRGKVLTKRNLRKSTIYFLAFSLIFNALPSAALSLEAGNIIDSSGIIGNPAKPFRRTETN